LAQCVELSPSDMMVRQLELAPPPPPTHTHAHHHHQPPPAPVQCSGRVQMDVRLAFPNEKVSIVFLGARIRRESTDRTASSCEWSDKHLICSRQTLYLLQHPREERATHPAELREGAHRVDLSSVPRVPNVRHTVHPPTHPPTHSQDGGYDRGRGINN
jgi:hypothetical protein